MSQNFTEFYKPWFSGTPVNAVKASINIGAGADGIITMHSDFVGTEGNDFTITVSDAGANDCNMSATISGKDITVILGKTVAALEPTKNTAILVGAAINALESVNAVYSGTGATSLAIAIAKNNFTGGIYATPAKTQGFIQISGTWYIAIKPISKWEEAGWYSAVPTVI